MDATGAAPPAGRAAPGPGPRQPRHAQGGEGRDGAAGRDDAEEDGRVLPRHRVADQAQFKYWWRKYFLIL